MTAWTFCKPGTDRERVRPVTPPRKSEPLKSKCSWHKEHNHETEPIHRRTDHRDTAPGRGRGARDGLVPTARYLGRHVLQVAGKIGRHGSFRCQTPAATRRGKLQAEEDGGRAGA